MRVLFPLVIGGLIIWGCKQEKTHSMAAGKSLGQLDQRLSEASGLAASVANPGMFWTVNDSGNPPEVFLIDQFAKTRMVCTLPFARNRDWEDIAIGAGPDTTKKYIYVADIGDNWSQYKLKYIYRFEEPILGGQQDVSISRFDTLILKMPDGSQDSEAVLVDPLTNDLFLISKNKKTAALYSLPYPFSRDTMELRKVMTLPFTQIVAGSISADGMEILLKNYDKIYYWKRSPGESLTQLLKRKPVELPYEREHQGEAITWSLSGNEFYTVSEGTSENPGNLLMYQHKKDAQ
jgi:hypothetical protein